MATPHSLVGDVCRVRVQAHRSCLDAPPILSAGCPNRGRNSSRNNILSGSPSSGRYRQDDATSHGKPALFCARGLETTADNPLRS
jgi:hypothetical protein